MINISTQVSTSPLVLKEGILANNDILSFDEFQSFMKKRLTQDVLNSLLSRFNQIAGHIRGGRYKKAYLMWENLEKDILLNKDYAVSLLFIENINSPEANYQYKYSTREYNVLGDSGELSRLSQLNKKLFKENIEEQISDHLSEFITDVETQQMRWKFIQEVFHINDSNMKKNAAEARWRTHNWSYKNILYGDNPAWQGNVADAFMNHMAHLHVQLIANELDDEDKELFVTSVFNEEKDNIFNLLYASKNNISWITGGDIIIKYNGQIYNIQLKTGQSLNGRRRSRIGGKLAAQELLKFIENIKNDIKSKNIDEIIVKMYNELKTSGWVENTNYALKDIVDNLSSLT